jgi:hypothetical protein
MPKGGDGKPVETITFNYDGTAPPPKGGDGKLPGIMGEPITGVDVNLGKNPGGSIVASSKTDKQGAFHFDKLPAGNYKLILPGLPSQSLTVGPDGIVDGKVMRGSDGSMSIFDRWGNLYTAPSLTAEGCPPACLEGDVQLKAAENPVGFGSGNTMGAGTGMGAGPGMGPGMSPGAGPAMGGPMSPGPSPGMGGGPMGPGAGKP